MPISVTATAPTLPIDLGPAPAPEPLSLLLRRSGEVDPADRRSLIAAVALVTVAHLAAAWGLLQFDPVRSAVHAVAPMMVDLLAPSAPPTPAAASPEAPPPATLPPRPAPPPPAALLAAAPPPTPAAEPFTAPAPPPEPPQPPITAPAVATPAPAPVAPPPPPAPPTRKVVPATAVEYTRLPPVEVPRLSRRAGESGTVWLRVVVDVRGQPAQVSVSRSSGYARLDEQALAAMRQARFKPHTEDGRPIELEVIAPVEYTLD